MSEKPRIAILGGHGKVALLAAGKFREAGYVVDSLIRNPDQRDDVTAAGGNPVVFDLESASVDDMIAPFTGAAAIVFSAGAGGGTTAERTRAVDHDAAIRTMEAARRAGVTRYIMVSFAGARVDPDQLDPSQPLYTYAHAKHDADARLRTTDLDYTILGPGTLTTEPASGNLRLTDGQRRDDEGLTDDQRVTSRANVAEVLVHVVAHHAASRQTVNFYDGDVPIQEAIPG